MLCIHFDVKLLVFCQFYVLAALSLHTSMDSDDLRLILPLCFWHFLSSIFVRFPFLLVYFARACLLVAPRGWAAVVHFETVCRQRKFFPMSFKDILSLAFSF